jgi:hypothetical protein
MKIIKKNTGILLASLMLMQFSFTSTAQDEEAIDNKELNRAIWTIQAVSVARDHGFDSKKESLLTETYITLREDISARGKEKLQGLEGDERKQESDKISQGCVEEFNEKLAEFLNPDEVAIVSFDLGSLNKRWDQYLKILHGFGLGVEQMDQASVAVYDYVHKYLRERKAASDANTTLSGYTATTLKENLDEKVAAVLNEDQYKEWTQATAFKRRSK